MNLISIHNTKRLFASTNQCQYMNQHAHMSETYNSAGVIISV